MSGPLLPALSWISAAVAVIGALAYVTALVRPPRYVRLVNGSGLMLSVLGLAEVASFAGRAADAGLGFNAELAEVFLIFAVLIQGWAANRRRKERPDPRATT